MIDPFATLQELTIPAGAGPGQARIYIGKRMPPELVAHYAPNPIVGGTISYDATGNYHYDVLLTNLAGASPAVVRGFFSAAMSPTVQSDVIEQITGTHDSASFNYAAVNTLLEILGTLQIDNGAPFTIDGKSVGRGLVWFESLSTPQAGVSAEAIMQNTAGMIWNNAHAYLLKFHRDVVSTTANGAAVYMLRRHSLTGTVLAAWAFPMNSSAGTSSECQGEVELINNTGAFISDDLFLTLNYFGAAGTLTENAGTTGTQHRRVFKAYDIGAASDYPNAVEI